ncbi:MAG: arylsulfatase [Planctomycetaceae bacterium]
MVTVPTHFVTRREFRARLLHRITTLALWAITGLVSLFCDSTNAYSEPNREQPNIVIILADDLGYGDLGSYGQQVIRTPRLDQMAEEGMKFRNFYCGNTVCAPSRSVLMTGQHMGHTFVRGNGPGAKQALRPEDVTVAEVLHGAGYATSLCGKWGLGDDQDAARSGLPRRQGFDHFFGYLNQVHAHNYYPEFLWRNEERVPLRNEVHKIDRQTDGFQGGWATKRVDYSHDLIADEALGFIREHRAGPFFLYLALTIPHANNEEFRATGNGTEVPDYGPYDAYEWPLQDQGQAAMITRMDGDVGRVLDLLKELQIAKQTVVMFASDNGPHQEGGQNPDRFDPNGPLRGFKRDLYEGGIRTPFIVWWPGTTPADSVSDHMGYFGDLMATAAELAGTDPPPNCDSISFVPEMTGHPEKQAQHDYLYWEFYERGSKQAIRKGDWKAVRMPMLTGQTELYNLSADLGEAHDIADQHPEVVQALEQAMNSAHEENPNWKVQGGKPGPRPTPGDGKARF